MEDWAHLIKPTENSKTINNYKNWVEFQHSLYKTNEQNVSKLLSNNAKLLGHPLSREEIENICFSVDSYSAIPLINESQKYNSQNNAFNPVLLYLGAGNDFEHSSLFFPQTSVFVDNNDYYKDAGNNFSQYFKSLGYTTKVETIPNQSHLRLEKDGLKKDFLFIKENIKDSEKVKEILDDSGITSIDFLIQKKASINPEHALNYIDLMHKAGLFLYSDIQVYKDIPGMTQLWHGELYSKRLQDGGDIETYPAKLFRKE
jgi:hypothetical protein